VIADAEFDELLAATGLPLRRLGPGPAEHPTLEQLIAAGSPQQRKPPLSPDR
jgi:hypothetical protein